MTVPDAPACPGAVNAQGGEASMWSILKARADAAAKAKAKKAKQAKKRKKARSKVRGQARKASKSKPTAKRNACGRAATQRSGE